MFLISPPRLGQMGNRCGKPSQMQRLAGFPGRCTQLFSSQLGRSLHYLPEGTREQMTSQNWLRQSRVSSGHAAGRGKEKAGQGPRRRDLVPSSLIPNGSAF